MALTNGFIHSDKDHNEFINNIREIRERESVTRDVKARKMMEELKAERARLNRPSPRDPVLVCRRMKHLPPVAENLRPQKTDV